MKKDVAVTFDDETWKKFEGYNEWIESLEAMFLSCVRKKYQGKKRCWNGLLLTNDKRIKILNRNFRGVNKPTNVLSFPEYEPELLREGDMSIKAPDIFLGDIAMSWEQIMRECKEYKISFFNRCSHLFVHGVLHLFGADHIDSKEQEEMESAEIEILKDFGISNPYVLEGEKNNI